MIRLLFFCFIGFASVFSQESDSLFLVSVKRFNDLVDYEAYETKLGKEVLAICRTARNKNESENDDSLQIYRNAVLDGFIGTILLKRNSYISGIAQTLESENSWEKLTNSRYADEADFALALAEYYKMTLFNKSPKNMKKLNAVINKMRGVISKDNALALKLSLSYIWILQEQQLFDEAEKLSRRFFAQYPDNTMMLRAMQTIACTKKNADEIFYYANKLAEISINREPLNYSDYLSAKRAKVFALGLENKQTELCEEAKSVIKFSETIPADTKKIYWVKKHLEAIVKEAKRCE